MIYEPKEDSLLLKKYVKRYAGGKILDVGCGSGILSLEAMKYSSDVLAVDIDPECVEYCKKKGINAKQSNLFSNVQGKFDLIIFNPPYLPDDENEDEESKKITTGGKKGYELIERFFSEVKNYLNKDGKILIVFSSLTGDVDRILEKYGFKKEKKEEKKLFFERLFVYVVMNK